MSVRLTRARVVAAVEECKKTAASRLLLLVGLDTRQRGVQIRGRQEMRLLLESGCREDEVLRHDGELVQDEEVRGAESGDVQ